MKTKLTNLASQATSAVSKLANEAAEIAKAELAGDAVRFVRVHEDAKIPQYMTPGAAGADLHAVMDDGKTSLELAPGERMLISTGLVAEIPEGYEMQIRPRSGLAMKNGVTVLNAPGTVDSDYRGEIAVLLINLGDDFFEVKKGMRIAQMVLAPVEQLKFETVESVSDLGTTRRGAGGFGSTGGAA